MSIRPRTITRGGAFAFELAAPFSRRQLGPSGERRSQFLPRYDQSHKDRDENNQKHDRDKHAHVNRSAWNLITAPHRPSAAFKGGPVTEADIAAPHLIAPQTDAEQAA